MSEDNVFVPSSAPSSGFSIKSSGSGIQIKKMGDSLNKDEVSDFSEKEVVVERVTEEGGSSRVKSGINGFDELIQGGFKRESIVLVVGASGTGKTIFSMQFLYNGIVDYDEPGVLISFGETKKQLFFQASQFGWDFDKLEKENKFRLLYFKPHQVTKILEEGGGQIRDALTEVKAKRIVIDSITAYELLFSDEYKRRERVLEFFNLLRRWGVTSLIVCEDDPEVVEKEQGGIGFISDAVVSLYYEQNRDKGIRIHSLEVLKMRGTKHTNRVCAINFEKDGITVYPDVELF